MVHFCSKFGFELKKAQFYVVLAHVHQPYCNTIDIYGLQFDCTYSTEQKSATKCSRNFRVFLQMSKYFYFLNVCTPFYNFSCSICVLVLLGYSY